MDLGIGFESLQKYLKLELIRERRIQNKCGEKLKKLDHIEKLKNFYKTISIYPDKDSLKYLSDQLNMDANKILRWFRNERYKNRSETKMKKFLIGIDSIHKTRF